MVMDYLPQELINIIVWTAFLSVPGQGNGSALATVSKQWYNILANINNLTTFLPSDPLRIMQIGNALSINRAIIRENTIAQYFPYLKKDDLSSYNYDSYINIFCVAYHKVTWQYMRRPTLVELEEYLGSVSAVWGILGYYHDVVDQILSFIGIL